MVLVNDPIVPASLFVATAADGLNPVNIKAGSEISPPPPTTESIKAAKNPNINNSKIIDKSMSNSIYRPSFIIQQQTNSI